MTYLKPVVRIVVLGSEDVIINGEEVAVSGYQMSEVQRLACTCNRHLSHSDVCLITAISQNNVHTHTHTSCPIAGP